MPAPISQRRRGAHYIPRPHFHAKDASQHAHALYQALQPWIIEALAGHKRHRFCSVNSRSVARDSDAILCDCAAALAAATEWDGFELAHQLRVRGWPGDIELVRLCNVWSCGLMDNIMMHWRARGPEFTRGND